jgi:hypothetical protein
LQQTKTLTTGLDRATAVAIEALLSLKVCLKVII